MQKLHGNLGLDAVRALAIFAVLLSHTYEWWLPPTRNSEILAAYLGNAGVELFFSLSGFLIGGILLRLEETGLDGRALLRFWVRRWMRTLPAYWAMLGLLNWHFHTWDWYTPFFLQSFVPRAEWTPLTIHTWSLVLEEWFYLFVPPLFVAALVISKRSRRAIPAVCAALILLSAMGRAIVEANPAPFWGPEAANNPILRLDCAAWGVLAASAVRNTVPSRRVAGILAAAGTFGLALLGWLFVESFTPERLISLGYAAWGNLYVPLRPSLTELFAACLVLGLSVLLPHGPRAIAWFAGAVAGLSYSLYLVHVPILFLLRLAGFDDAHGWAVRGLMAAAVLIGAIAMRVLVERPVLAIRDRFAPERSRPQIRRSLNPHLRGRLSRIGLPGLIAIAACAGAVILLAIRARVGLVTLEFGDETEKYVAAVMLRHGGRLYADIFANHGPLAYVLAWLTTFVFGVEDFTRTRLVVVALALAAGAAIAASPALPRRTPAPLWAAALFLAPLSSLWFVHPLHMLIYHAIGGYLMTIVLAQLTLPAIGGSRIGPVGAALSGAAATLATTAAYPFATSGALLAAAAMLAVWAQHGWRPAGRMLAWLAAGALIAAVPMAAWITARADWVGLYVYHVYFNQVVYGRIIAYSPLNVFHSLALSFAPAGRAHSFTMLAGGLGLAGAIPWRAPVRTPRLIATAMMALGILALNPKGDPGFPDTAEMIACFGLLALAGGRCLAQAQGRRLAAGSAAACLFVAAAEGVARTATISPHGMRRSEAPLVFLKPDPSDLTVAELHKFVPAGETMLALPFMPATYLFAARLPASAAYYDLPFQAEYNKAPILNRSIDLCADIDRVRPRAIAVGLQPFPVWGSILEYEPCLARLLAQDYQVSRAIPFIYLRKQN